MARLTQQTLKDGLQQIADKAVSTRMSDKSFRAHVLRTLREMPLDLLPEHNDAKGTRRRTARAQAQEQPTVSRRYAFVAVPNGEGGTTSVSIQADLYEQWAAALGGPTQVSALARKIATKFKDDSGMSRSEFVRRRIGMHAGRAGAAAAESPRAGSASRTRKAAAQQPTRGASAARAAAGTPRRTRSGATVH